MSNRISVTIPASAIEKALPEPYRELRARMDPAKRYVRSTAWIDGALVLMAEEIEAVPAKVMSKLVSSKA